MREQLEGLIRMRAHPEGLIRMKAQLEGLILMRATERPDPDKGNKKA